MTTFASLGVPEVLAVALAKRGITVPTEIQTALIPAAYAGENLIGEAPTGTGKTLAYLLPLLTRIDPSLRSVQALILAPRPHRRLSSPSACRRSSAERISNGRSRRSKRNPRLSSAQLRVCWSFIGSAN